MKDNPIRKERLENLKKASALPFGKRVRYYFDFFEFYIFALIIVGIIIFFVLKEIVFAPEVILNGYLVNRTEITEISDEEFISSFPEYQNHNPKKEKLYFSSDIFFNDTDIESAAKLIATVSSGEVNYIICNEETFNRLCLLGLFANIESFPELKDKYNDDLFYYDHTKNDTSEDDSEGVKPYGIDISDSAALKSLNAFHDDEKIYLCIGINSYPDEIVISFIDWIKQ